MEETSESRYGHVNIPQGRQSRIPVLVSPSIVPRRTAPTARTANEIRKLMIQRQSGQGPLFRSEEPPEIREITCDQPNPQANRTQPHNQKISNKPRHSVISIESRNDPTPEEYLDRITICGLHNYLYATTALERRFWFMIFVLATAGTLTYLVPAFQQYLTFTTVWDIQHQTQPAMKIPNPYVCVWALNFSDFRAKFESVKTQVYEDQRLIVLKHRIGRQFAKLDPAYWANRTYDSEMFLKNTLDYMAAGIVGDTQWIDDIRHEYMDEAITKSIEFMGSNYDGVRVHYDRSMFLCTDVLRNCTLNGKPIDCCRDSLVGTMMMTSKCFKLDIQRELAELNLTESDQRNTLSFETIMDSAYAPSSDILYRGPSVITIGLQNHPYNGFEASDITLAVGTSSLITVSGRFKRQMFGCMEKFKYNPKLHEEAPQILQEYFMNMTEEGRYNAEECGEGKLVEKLAIECGCVPYFKSIHPNDSIICTPGQIYACMHAATQPDGADESDPQSISSRIDVWPKLKLTIDKECVPLCETWSYDATVSSMDAEGDAGNVSQFYRSKVTIVLEPEYIVEEETLQMDYHGLIATIGDDLGLILGMSFITFVQIAYWSAEAIRVWRRSGRVSPEN